MTTAEPSAAGSTSPSAAADRTAAHDVTDLGLAAEGVRRIEWAERAMPVLRQVRERFAREHPLRGVGVAACLHVTTETAVLMLTLKAGGAAPAAAGQAAAKPKP